MEKQDRVDHNSSIKQRLKNRSVIEKDFDYFNAAELRRYLTATGRIRPRKLTGLSSRSQRSLSVAVKRARIMALLPFIVRPKASFR